jgi:two-component system, chemotaxis family, response regulator Rcp1
MNTIMNGLRPIEILLVEDNVDEAEWTTGALSEGRVRSRIHWVEDGEEAMAFLRQEGRYAAAPRPDLVLLDWNLPRMNGQEVLMEIKLDPRWKRIPVVVMTSSTAEKDLISAYDRHANCFVNKPVTMDKFLEAVRSIEEFWLSVARLPAA